MKKIDKSVFLKQFQQEAEEHIKKLQEGLIILEQDSYNRGTIDEIFRIAHTLKGAATMMGFNDIRDVAHKMEDILDKTRNKDMELNENSIDILLQAVDIIKVMVDGKLSGIPVDVEVDQILQKLDTVIETPSISEKTIIEIEEKKEGKIIIPRLHTEDTLRVDVSKLDELLNLAGELIISKSRLEECIKEFSKLDIRSSKDNHFEEKFSKNLTNLKEAHSKIDLFSHQMQQRILKIRMIPLSTVYANFSRLVREAARDKGKRVRLEFFGSDTELDKRIVDEIQDPMMHIIRNCVDHGIEEAHIRERIGKPPEGKITINAFSRGGQVTIEIADDGRGIDREKVIRKAMQLGIIDEKIYENITDEDIVSFIFSPGFSTADEVTTTSGRGVGLDAVKEKIERLKGSINIKWEEGRFTKFIIKLPLTLSLAEVLLIRVAQQTFALPLVNIEEMISVKKGEIKSTTGKDIINLRGDLIPLFPLSELLNIKTIKKEDKSQVVITSVNDKKVGLIVDKLIGKQEIVIKSLGNFLSNVLNISGATILGYGEIVPILDIQGIITQAKTIKPQKRIEKKEEEQKKIKMLVVEDSITTGEVERSILEIAGYTVELAYDGIDALNKLRQDKFDLVVTDIEMPRMDGFELIERMKKEDGLKDIPVVVVTTKESEEDKKRGIEAGADAYVLKSAFNQRELLNIIKKLI